MVVKKKEVPCVYCIDKAERHRDENEVDDSRSLGRSSSLLCLSWVGMGTGMRTMCGVRRDVESLRVRRVKD